MKVAVIGGGASGIVASIFAAKSGSSVTVYDKNSDVLKKLLLTGNGKCNYGNVDQSISHYHSLEEELIPNIINENNLLEKNSFLNNIGLVSFNKNGYLYPFSNKSQSVKSALKKEAKEDGVNFRLDIDISNIEFINDKFYLDGEAFDKVVIATGAKSYSKTGSDGMGYIFAKKFGHKINKVNPSLVQVISNMKIEKFWSGIRSEVSIELWSDDTLIKSENGEIQFTDYGLSGICVFNLSRYVRNLLDDGKNVNFSINLVPWFKDKSFLDYLDERNKLLKNRNITELCDGFLDYKLIFALLKYLGIDSDKSWNELIFKEKQLISDALTNLKVDIVDTKGFENAQTCSGGIPLSELNLDTMESKLQKGLYFCGEIIDVDGDCGGYNLTFAFISGMLAGLGVCND